jgi:hypothetical protein
VGNNDEAHLNTLPAVRPVVNLARGTDCKKWADSMIQFTCQLCGQLHLVDSEHPGNEITCPLTRAPTRITQATAFQEPDWLNGNDPSLPLTFVKPWASARKCRLFACACANNWLHLIHVPIAKQIIEQSEEYADLRITQEQLHEVYQTGQTLFEQLSDPESDKFLVAWMTAYPDACTAALSVAQSVQRIVDVMDARYAQTSLLYDIFGNPFRSECIEAPNLTSEVDGLARFIYQERAFGEMPILADALQDAGCENNTILEHCRQPDKHVQGCWVVDLLLSKK